MNPSDAYASDFLFSAECPTSWNSHFRDLTIIQSPFIGDYEDRTIIRTGVAYKMKFDQTGFKFRWSKVLMMVMMTAALLLTMTGCSLAPSQKTMDRQAKAPWWSSPSVSNGVYAPAVQREVYSTEP